MNPIHHLIWNHATQRYVAAPKIAPGCSMGRPGMGRPGMGRPGKNHATRALTPLAMLLGTLLASPAGAQTLPTGPELKSGQASISQSGSQMTIDQGSPKAILHWKSFDIGSGNKVHFNQPNASAIALNRVLGNTASRIDGQLSANGQVWLVNPNGVVFGQGSKVDVGGLVASTLDITDADFNADKRMFTLGKAKGGITNHGGITVTNKGTLALLATEVKNEGTLNARMGNVVLAGGEKVTLQAGAGGRLEVAVEGRTLRTLIENKRLIVADGGQVVMTAGAADALAGSVVSNSGTVQAHTLAQESGRILLLADRQHGQVAHGGLLDASALQGGDGGWVETRAAKVTLPDGHQITTHANHGSHTGTWRIEAQNFSIGSPYERSSIDSNLTGEQLSQHLAHNNVSIHSAPGGAKGHRDLCVDNAVNWSKNTLSLHAARDIGIHTVMTASGEAQLEMNHGGYSASNPTAAAGSGVYTLPGPTQENFAGRVDFTGTHADGSSSNALRINGAKYTILTRLGSSDSATGQDLQGMRHDLAGKYALGADIDASATKGWNAWGGLTRIGDPNAPFTGTFDGLGHHITDLVINHPDLAAVGLFGAARNATLRNVALDRGFVKGYYEVGALVGRSEARDGGTASVSTAIALMGVEGYSDVGGLVGTIDAHGATALIDRSFVQGNKHMKEGWVKGRDRNAGGLVGNNAATGGMTSIRRSAASVRVAGKSVVGGLVGINQARGGLAVISDSQSGGYVTGEKEVGGLVGSNLAKGGMASITASRASGDVSGKDKVGGLIGSNAATSGTAIIRKSVVSNEVDGKGNVGGVAGLNSAMGDGTAHIDDIQAIVEVRGETNVGFAVGHNHARAGVALISKVDVKAGSGDRKSSDSELVGRNHAIGGIASITHADNSDAGPVGAREAGELREPRREEAHSGAAVGGLNAAASSSMALPPGGYRPPAK